MDKAVRDCDWEYLSTLETLKEPRQHMCRLSDVLEFLAEPGNESIWMLLDIKIDDPPAEMIPKIAAAIASAPRGKWEQRIVLGCWRVSPYSPTSEPRLVNMFFFFFSLLFQSSETFVLHNVARWTSRSDRLAPG